MEQTREPILTVTFYRSANGKEPVRDWLKGLDRPDRKTIGEDIKTAQYGWPIGMPLIEKLEPGLWQVRSHMRDGIARTMFTVDGHEMVLLHAFVKKTPKAPQSDLKIARQRLADLHKE